LVLLVFYTITLPYYNRLHLHLFKYKHFQFHIAKSLEKNSLGVMKSPGILGEEEWEPLVNSACSICH